MSVKSRAEIKLMTEEEKKEYQKELNRERVRKYREQHKETPEYKEKHKEQTYKWRETHPEQFKELNKRNKQTYNNKQKALNLNEVMTKINAINIANDMTDDIFKQVLETIPEKKRAGRPRKPRRPVGRPVGSKNKKKV